MRKHGLILLVLCALCMVCTAACRPLSNMEPETSEGESVYTTEPQSLTADAAREETDAPAARRLLVSFLGDSITTFAGYSNNEVYQPTLAANPTWYTTEKMSVRDTWWYGVTERMGWMLCVNNSYSGGRVTHPYSYETRARNLHLASGETPDVILVYYGINDYNNNVSLSEFSAAYDQMIAAMRETYPQAQILCCTLNPIICTDNGRNTSLEQNGAGVALTAFNTAILLAADRNGAEIIDFYTQIGDRVYQNTYDRIHPNAEGMALMRDAALSVLGEIFERP